MWDSPGCTCWDRHIAYSDCVLDLFNFNAKFRCDLCFWTNINGQPEPTPVPIRGPTPSIPDAACCLYSTVQSNTWDIIFEISFDQRTGNGKIGTPAAVSLQKDSSPTRLARPVMGEQFEVYNPTVVRLSSWNARD
jgi:hypothetical protein